MMTAVTVALMYALMTTVGVNPDISQAESLASEQQVAIEANVEEGNTTSDIEVSSKAAKSKIAETKNLKKENETGAQSRAQMLAVLRNRRTNRGTVNRVNYEPFGINCYTAKDYDVMLEDTGLKGCGEYFKEMEIIYNVNALFAIAVAGLESGNGFKPMSGNNYFGMVGMEFKNKKKNILYFGELLSGRLYKGAGRTTLETIGARYSASCLWPSKIDVLMKEYAAKV